MRIAGLNVVEVFGGAIISAIGLYFVVQGSHYSIGTLNHMGAGFFPVAVGVILVTLGAAIAYEGRELDTPLPQFRFLAFIGIVGGMIAWAMLVEPFGLVPATIALVLPAGLGERRYRPLSVLVTILLLCVGGTLLFIKGLHLPIAIISW